MATAGHIANAMGDIDDVAGKNDWVRAIIDVPGVGGGVVALAGWRLLRLDEPVTRERGWEAEAVGVALLAAGWLAALAAAGRTTAR